MGKNKKTKTPQATTAATSTGVSAIEDIFAQPGPSSRPVIVDAPTDGPSRKKKKKGIPTFIPDVADEAKYSSAEEPTKKKKKKKAVTEAESNPNPNATATTPPASGRTVEEVLDPELAAVRAQVEAARREAAAVRAGVNGKELKKEGKALKRSVKDREADLEFADSRGTGPRRKTEEGFLIYKEAELKIDPEAGGTPLCPFDCECCF